MKNVAAVQNPPGPPLERHSVKHESVILGTPLELFQAIVQRMHRVINMALVRNSGIRCLDTVLVRFEEGKITSGKSLCLLVGHRIFPHEREDMEVVIVPSEEWPNHRSFGFFSLLMDLKDVVEVDRRVPDCWSRRLFCVASGMSQEAGSCCADVEV